MAKSIETRLKKIEEGLGVNESKKYPMAVMTLSPNKDATAQFGQVESWESYKQLINYCEAQNQTTIVFTPDPKLEKKARKQLLSQDELEQLRSHSPLIN